MCTEKTVVTDPLGTVRGVLDMFHKQVNSRCECQGFVVINTVHLQHVERLPFGYFYTACLFQCLDVGAKEFSLEPNMDVINR